MNDMGPIKQSPRRSEAQLAFMLAEQALARWNFRLVELQQVSGVGSADQRELLLVETRLGIQQMTSLAERMQSFSRSKILPVRFQAQEMLVAVARVEKHLVEVQRQLQGQAPARAAEEVAAALLGRARGDSRGRSSRTRHPREDAASAPG